MCNISGLLSSCLGAKNFALLLNQWRNIDLAWSSVVGVANDCFLRRGEVGKSRQCGACIGWVDDVN
jgi:hypothetical protein